MELAKAGRLLLEQRHQVLRLRVAGIAAGHEDGVDARQLREHLRPLLQRELDLFWIAVVLVERGIPDPDVLRILVGKTRHLHHHVDLRQREVRAVGGVVRPGRNQLDRVRAEDREVADVLLPHRHVPRVVGVGFRPVAELMAAQSDLWGRDDVEARRERGCEPRCMRNSRSSRPTPKSTPRASAPRTSTVGALRRRCVERDAVSFASGCSRRRPAPRSPAPAHPDAVASGPTAIAGTVAAGHWVATGRRTLVRFATSSTRTRTAVRSWTLRFGGVTMVARVTSTRDGSSGIGGGGAGLRCAARSAANRAETSNVAMTSVARRAGRRTGASIRPPRKRVNGCHANSKRGFISAPYVLFTRIPHGGFLAAPDF